MRVYLMFILLFYFYSISMSLRATDRYVVEPGTIGFDKSALPYNAWTNAATNIQWAVDAAVADETVYVSNGTYAVTNEITITNRITLRSMNGYTNTLVSADWPAHTNVRCFYVANTGVVYGFTISNGHYMISNDYSGGGGALITNRGRIHDCYFVNNVCSNAGRYAGGGGAFIYSGVISNCLVISNVSCHASGLGGGIYVYYDDIGGGEVLNCNVISNYANSGGGIYLRYLQSFVSNCFIGYNTCVNYGGGISCQFGVIKNSVISNNATAWYGGGIYLSEGAVYNCSIVDNRSDYEGGGCYYAGSHLIGMSNCVVAGNRSARRGGGIYYDGGSWDCVISHCRISNNICLNNYGGGGVFIKNSGKIYNSLICNNTNLSTGSGGGVLLENAALVTNRPYGLVNCTIVNNYSTNEGGGISASGLSNYIVNCVVANNTSFSNNYPDVYNTGVNSNNYHYCCATGVVFASHQGNITNNPMFNNPSAGNWRLQANSPCVNTGINQNWMTNAYDLDGRIRIRYGTVDMGAYEVMYEGTIFSF